MTPHGWNLILDLCLKNSGAVAGASDSRPLDPPHDITMRAVQTPAVDSHPHETLHVANENGVVALHNVRVGMK